MDLGHEVNDSVALDTPKTVLVDARNLTRKRAAPPEDWWWLRSFDLLRSSMDFGHEVSESVVHDTPKTATGVARISKTKI